MNHFKKKKFTEITNTRIVIVQKSFYKQVWEPFLSRPLKCNFSETWMAHCCRLSRVRGWRWWIFPVLLVVNPNRIFNHWAHPKVVESGREKECLCLVEMLHACSSQIPASETQCLFDQNPDTRLCAWLVCLHWGTFHPSFHVLFTSWDWIVFEAICCPKCLVSAEVANSLQHWDFSASWLSSFGRDPILLLWHKLLQNRGFLGYSRWKLKKLCGLNLCYGCSSWNRSLYSSSLPQPAEIQQLYTLGRVVMAFCGSASFVADCDCWRCFFRKKKFLLLVVARRIFLQNSVQYLLQRMSYSFLVP